MSYNIRNIKDMTEELFEFGINANIKVTLPVSFSYNADTKEYIGIEYDNGIIIENEDIFEITEVDLFLDEELVQSFTETTKLPDNKFKLNFDVESLFAEEEKGMKYFTLLATGLVFNFEGVKSLYDDLDYVGAKILQIHNFASIEEVRNAHPLKREDIAYRLATAAFVLKTGMYFKNNYLNLLSIIKGMPYAPIGGKILGYKYNSLYGYTGVQIESRNNKKYWFWFSGDFRNNLWYNIDDEIERGDPLTNLIDIEIVRS